MASMKNAALSEYRAMRDDRAYSGTLGLALRLSRISWAAQTHMTMMRTTQRCNAGMR